MTHDPLVDAAGRVADALYALGREWEAAGDAARDRDPTGVQHDALHIALSERYPFGRDLDELGGMVADWTEHVEQVMANPPGPLSAAAQDIAALNDAVVADLKETTDDNLVEHYRRWQTGGLGGPVGDIGAVLGLGIAGPLARLLTAVEKLDGADAEATYNAAVDVATAIREGRKALIRPIK